MTEPPRMYRLRVHPIGTGTFMDLLVPDPIEKFMFVVRSMGYIQGPGIHIPYAGIGMVVDLDEADKCAKAKEGVGAMPIGGNA